MAGCSMAAPGTRCHVPPRWPEAPVAQKHYDWSGGPAEIEQHSIAKHTVLRAYLARYFSTLVSSPRQEVLRLTLVDGFAGGGQYIHRDTRELVLGSPFICLDAVAEAEARINADRRKPVKLDVNYFFVEKDKAACQHLERILRERNYVPRLGVDIHVRHARFQDQAQSIIEAVQKRSPRVGRSIFVLDQYGYSEVPGQLIRRIFSALPAAEVILTFAVDALLTYATDQSFTPEAMEELGIDDVLRGRTLEDIKHSESDWRLFIQSGLYRGLVNRCGARHYTPFFIRNSGGHGNYWLIHLSMHHRARDVMTEVHWSTQNQFIHYGGAGLDMFHLVGYDPDHDSSFAGQHGLGFEFDDVARKSSVRTLMAQIPGLVYARPEGLTFGELFASTCNDSPASAEIYREAIENLIHEKVLEVVGEDGATRRSAQIKGTDRLLAPQQGRFIFGA